MGFLDKLQRLWNPPEDEYEEYEEEVEETAEEEQEEVKQPEPARTPLYESFTARRSAPAQQPAAKVVNLQSAPQMRVALFKPTSFGEETRQIADELTNMHTVVLNLEKTDAQISRRVIDFLSGVAYAQNGRVKRIATGTFLVTPNNVDFTGEMIFDDSEDNSDEDVLL